jgi:EAL domain-containing protein (putative c-di-GMP-specific phosphodiesterase class I)
MPEDPIFRGLIVEIDSVDVVRDLGRAKGVASRLRSHKMAVSIDDVGSEWPILLLDAGDFPFVEVKIDQHLIAGCADSERMRNECGRVLRHIDRLGARSVADGVETNADFSAVRQMGFDLVQGFLFAKPMTAQKLARTMLRQAAVTVQ